MVYKACDIVDWGLPNRRLTYIKRNYIRNEANDNFCKALVAINMTSSPTEGMSNDITALDVSEFINARFDNCEFILDVHMFDKHQQQDKVLQNIIKEELKRHPNSTVYTHNSRSWKYLFDTQN